MQSGIRVGSGSTNIWQIDKQVFICIGIVLVALWGVVAAFSVLDRAFILGCHIAIDKFGTEYSSIDYPRNYAVNQLKINRSFGDEAVTDVKAQSLLAAMIRLGSDMGIGVVVEGIEPEDRRRLLTSTAQMAGDKGGTTVLLCLPLRRVRCSRRGVCLHLQTEREAAETAR